MSRSANVFPSFLGHGAVLAVQKIVNGGAPLAVIILAGIICPEDIVASLSYKLTVASIVLVLSDIGISRLLTRSIVRGDRAVALPWLVLIRLAAGAALWASFLLWPFSPQPLLHHHVTHLLLAMCWSLGGSISMAFYGWNLGFEDYRFLGRGLSASLGVMTLVWLMALSGVGVADRMLLLGMAGGRLAEIILFTMDGKLKEGIGGGFKRSLSLCREGFYLLAQQLTSMVYSRFTVLVVGGLLSVQEFSGYSVVRSVYSAMALIPASMAHSHYPEMVRIMSHDHRRAISSKIVRIIGRTVLIHLPFCILVAGCVLWGAELHLPAVVFEHRMLVALVLMGNVLTIGTSIIAFVFLAMDRESLLFKLSVFNAVLAFGITFTMTQQFGLAGSMLSVIITDTVTIAYFSIAGWAALRASVHGASI